MLWKEVDLSEPAQCIGCHPVSWRDHGKPTRACVDADEYPDPLAATKEAIVAAVLAVENPNWTSAGLLELLGTSRDHADFVNTWLNHIAAAVEAYQKVLGEAKP